MKKNDNFFVAISFFFDFETVTTINCVRAPTKVYAYVLVELLQIGNIVPTANRDVVSMNRI